MTTIPQAYVIGIAIRTTNENGQSSTDIPALWARFFTENISVQIPNKLGDNLYCIYTEYELDHTKPYTTVLGCRVENLSQIPEGFKGITIAGGSYAPFVAKGKLSDNIVFEEWLKIWSTDLPRSYTTDFEIYGEKAQNPEDAEVEIYISVDH
ncbi:MAG TPA: GyrI-like domain-containing protein [Pedobacter sp.]|nr:GyrI-like domain-containing protein [Pedobacter sp.]